MAANIRQVRFINNLLSQVPDLQPTYEEHLRDEGELLPHLFLGDVTRFVVEQCKKLERDRLNSGNAEQNLTRIMSLMEEGITSPEDGTVPMIGRLAAENESVRNLVGVSFVENLLGTDCPSLTKYLTPAIAADLRQYTSS